MLPTNRSRPIRCSTSRACRASAKSLPEHVGTRRSTHCSPMRERRSSASPRQDRAPTWESFVAAARRMRRIASTAPGARSRISTQWSIRRRCARRITRTCPRSRRSTPSSDRTSGCSRGYRALAAAPDFAQPRSRAAQAHRERAARFPAFRRRASRRIARRASRRSRKSWRASPRASRTTCSTRPTTTRCTSSDAAELAGVPADVLAAAREAAAQDGRPAGSSRCACPAICRCCNTRRPRACARRFIAHSPCARANSASPNGTTPH